MPTLPQPTNTAGQDWGGGEGEWPPQLSGLLLLLSSLWVPAGWAHGPQEDWGYRQEPLDGPPTETSQPRLSHQLVG